MCNSIKFDTGLGWKTWFEVTKDDAIDFINSSDGEVITLSCGMRTLEKKGDLVLYFHTVKKSTNTSIWKGL